MTNRSEIMWGYRLEDGTEVWEVDHGHDGIWTPAVPERGIPAVDLYSGQERDAIRRTLDCSGHSSAEVLQGNFASNDLSEDSVSQPESDTVPD